MAQTRRAPQPDLYLNDLAVPLRDYWDAKKQVANIDAAAERLKKALYATFTAIDATEAKLQKAKNEHDRTIVSALLAGRAPADPIGEAQRELDAAREQEAAIERQKEALAAERVEAERDVAAAKAKLDEARGAVVRPHVEILKAAKHEYEQRILSIEAALSVIASELPAAAPYWSSKRQFDTDRALANRWRTALQETTRTQVVKIPSYP